ncbi:MAG: hypothetical protein ABH865_08470 [Candidatus Omnitrophota bacterium]
MKKAVVFFFLVTFSFQSASALFNRISDIEDAYLKRVVISSFDKNLFYVASRNSLYKTLDGKAFTKVAVFKGEEIQHIFFDSSTANVLYCATTRHLYKITDATEQLYTCPEESIILTAAQHEGELYVGTTNGLAVAVQDVLKWESLKRVGDDTAIYWIEPASSGIWLATGRGVYYCKDKDTVTRVFVIREKEQTGEEESGIVPRTLRVDIFDAQRLWLGTNKGMHVSYDAGQTWKKFYADSVKNVSINALVQSPLERETIYAATEKGLFKINIPAKTSRQLFEGLESLTVLWIEFGAQGDMYLATAAGLFQNVYFTQSQTSSVEKLLIDEPAIGEIQEAAIRYNEVHPEKIRRWRSALKYRALLPTVNWSYDKTVYGSSSGSFATGPRDWGLSFGWDMGNIIWNSYQDDVDTRSRLNTQLRLDILDEINRVYFERLRTRRALTQADLSQDELFQTELRLKELTAMLDGYTGGFFSKRTEELNEE